MASSRIVAGGLAAALTIAGGLIAKWEGVRYVPYLDVGGVLTVCVGHTGPDVIPGKRYTPEDCKRFLDADTAIARATVHRCLPMPLLPQIEGALTSATFNAGPNVVCGSTLQRKGMANDWPAACRELSRWVYVKRSVSPGLENRRADERAVCEGRAVLEDWT
jgi:lysozyme